MNTKSIIMASVGAILFALFTVLYFFSKSHMNDEISDAMADVYVLKQKKKNREVPDNPKAVLQKSKQKKQKLFFVAALISLFFFIGVILTALCGLENKLGIEFEMFSKRVNVFGISLAQTTVIAACVTLVLIILIVLFRVIAVPKFSKDSPKGIQNALELIVEYVDRFVENATEAEFVKLLSPFMLSVALFMIGAAASELLGLRAPTSDLTCTLSLGLCTLALINICGIKKNGIAGRLRNMGGAVPAMRPIMIPLKAVSDIAVPVSLACRLFGNMLGGMMVMDLLKGVLGGYASGIPAVAGLYFNLFHPGIQIYIFITLSLTFINEALEDPAKEL